LAVDLDKSAISSQVAAVSLTLTMSVSVVFVNSSSTDQLEVGPSNEAAPLIKDLFLRLDIDADWLMQNSHDRFPGGFTAIVQKRQHRSEARGATSLLCGSGFEFLDGAVAGTQRRVTENHQVKDSQVSGRGEQCFGTGRDLETVDSHRWHRLGMAAHEKAFPLGVPFPMGTAAKTG
jgi:hypothetical protein